MAVKRRSARGRAQRISNRQRGRPQPDSPTTAAPPTSTSTSTSNLHLQPTSLLAQGEVDPDVEVSRFAVLQVETEVAFVVARLERVDVAADTGDELRAVVTFVMPSSDFAIGSGGAGRRTSASC